MEGDIMKALALFSLAAAALLATAGTASAQYYGPGYGPGYGPRYDRDYDDPRYRRGYGGNRGGPDCYTYHGRRICCPRRWTVQDGVCKPYRGG